MARDPDSGTAHVDPLPAHRARLADGVQQSAIGPITDFRIKVTVVSGGKPERFEFDQDAVIIGRGEHCHLRIEHACVSREQLRIERSLSASGEPRFRVVPGESVTNPTYLNGYPAVEGALRAGDLIAVGEIRLVLERQEKKERASIEPKEGKADSPLTPLRMVLLAACVGMAALVAYLLFFDGDEAQTADLTASAPLFAGFPEPHCANPVECDAKAHEMYDRGRKSMAASATDPGNLYRATLDFARARSYREQSGRPLGDIADVEQRFDTAKKEAEAAFDDARFALKRAIAANDLRRQANEAALLAKIVPDENHPYRVKLDVYRRTLPKPKVKDTTSDDVK